MFWLACEDLKKETSPEVIEERARVIYEDFISILSPKEVRKRIKTVKLSTLLCLLSAFCLTGCNCHKFECKLR